MPKLSGPVALPIVRGGFLVVATGMAMAAVTAHGLGVVLADRKPGLALRFAPYNADALASAARRAIVPDASPADLAASEATARAALARSPVLASALTSIGLIADLKGDRPKAKQLLRSSAALTRRDLPTRLWLIEEAVTRGEVDEALHHYDIALRTSLRAPEILFPRLGDALSDPVIAHAVGRLFETRPPWMGAFIHHIIMTVPAPEALGDIVANLHPVQTYGGQNLDKLLVENFIGYGKLRSARAVGIGTVPAAARSQLVVDPSFVNDIGLPPINWALTIDKDLVAERSPIGGRPGLVVTVNTESDAIAASQILALPPGTYRLASEQVESSWTAQESPYWTVSCGGTQNQQIGVLELAPESRLSEGRFVVLEGGDCNGQWLRLHARPTENREARTVHIAKVQIDRVD